MITNDQIEQKFRQCIHCSQVVLTEWAEELGYSREEAARMSAPFGGGMFRGDTCGAVAGAMMAIGMRYGHCQPNDTEGNAAMMAKVKQFQEAFIAKHGSVICRDLTGYDFSQPGELEKAMGSGALFRECPKYVQSALEILDDIM